MKKVIDLLREAIGILELESAKPFNAKVELSTLKAGDVFETSFGEMIVLDNFEEKTLVITKGFVSDGRKFDEETPNFAESDISEYLSGEVLEMFEEEFGSENLVEHTTDVISFMLIRCAYLSQSTYGSTFLNASTLFASISNTKFLPSIIQ